MEQYIIPANSKKSILIFGLFRMVDLIIFSVGAVFTLFFLFVLPGTNIGSLIIKLLPLLIALFLVLPIPNYHNTLVLIREVVDFFMNRRIYLWKGWCVLDGADEK